jgi:hypothetical protein
VGAAGEACDLGRMDPYAPHAPVVAAPPRPAARGPARAAAWLAVSLMLTYVAPNVVAGLGVFFSVGLANAFDYPVDAIAIVERVVTATTGLLAWLVVTISLVFFTRAIRGWCRVGARIAVFVLLAFSALRLFLRLVATWYSTGAAVLWNGDIPEWFLFLFLSAGIRDLAPRAGRFALVALALDSFAILDRLVNGNFVTPTPVALSLGALNIILTTAAQVVLAIALFKTRTVLRERLDVHV